jgi:hypothetical protein
LWLASFLVVCVKLSALLGMTHGLAIYCQRMTVHDSIGKVTLLRCCTKSGI